MGKQKTFREMAKIARSDTATIIGRLSNDSLEAKGNLAALRKPLSFGPRSSLDILRIMTVKHRDPEEVNRNDRYNWAVYISLSIFAIQCVGSSPSEVKKNGKIILEKKNDEETKIRSISLGDAMGRLEAEHPDNRGIKKRISKIFALDAKDMESVNVSLRNLVKLLKANNITIDCPKLAEDLYLIQSKWNKNEVIMQWGRDYQRSLWLCSHKD